MIPEMIRVKYSLRKISGEKAVRSPIVPVFMESGSAMDERTFL